MISHGSKVALAAVTALCIGMAKPAGTATCVAGGVAAGNAAAAGVPPANLSVSTACAVYAGNDGVAEIALFDPFGITSWVLADKSDDTDNGGANDDGDNSIIFAGVGGGQTSGNWSVASFLGYSEIMFTLKQGDEFAAFKMDTSSKSGFWVTAGLFMNKKGEAQDLSHVSVFYDPNSRIDPVPLPGALLLLGSAIAWVFGYEKWWKRRRIA
jgi:hypothetical protein